MYTLVDTVLHANLQRDSWEALLHKPIADATHWVHTLITHMFMATKQTIARSWKTLLLSFEKIKKRVHGSLINKRLMAILKDKYDKFQMDLAALDRPLFTHSNDLPIFRSVNPLGYPSFLLPPSCSLFRSLSLL